MSSTTAAVKKTVALVFGGRSSEHTISCATAGSVLREIDRSAFEIVPIGITKDGRMLLQPDDPDRLVMDPKNMPEVLAEGDEVLWPKDADSRMLRRVTGNGVVVDLARIDVVFPLLHGPYGEDGTLQGALELSGIPYVGSGVLASAAGMDKQYTKTILAAAGLEVGRYTVVHSTAFPSDFEEIASRTAELGYPVFVKPARAGSSVGVSKVKSVDQLAEALRVAFGEDSKALIEAAAVGREVECGVLGNPGGEPKVSTAIGEILMTGHEFYDFEAKYLDEAAAQLICPADLTTDQVAEIRRISAAAFTALGCEGLARIDMFLTEHGFVINEVNTMPGFTPISMFPTVWLNSGLTYRDLISYLLDIAVG